MPRPKKQHSPTPTPEQLENQKTYEVTVPTVRNEFTGRELPAIPKNFKYREVTREDVQKHFFIAFELIGGVSRFAEWAEHNPDKFYSLYQKLLPEQKIESTKPTEISITLKNGDNLPESPLDAVEVRDESVVNARYIEHGKKS